jgi:chromobox protein 1
MERVQGAYKRPFVVERILDHKIVAGEVWYLVKWQGWDDPQDLTWEPQINMKRASFKVSDYQRKLPSFSIVPPPGTS